MEALLRPMRRLREDGAWFARAKEIRCWYVATTADLAQAATKVAVAQECHADNDSLFFTFEEPLLPGNEGWHSRAERLRKSFAEKQKGLSEAGIAVAPLAARPSEPPADELLEFTAVLQQVVSSLTPPLRGIVVVLSPTRTDGDPALVHRIRSLVDARGLVQVRWIVVERDSQHLRRVAEDFGDRGQVTECFQDDAEYKKDFAALAGPPDLSPVVPDAPRVWRAPGAGPDVVAPPRKREAPPPTDEQLRAEGLSPLYVKGGGERLRNLQLNSALAASEGRYADAARLQSAAADLCARMEMPREQAAGTMVLGSYLLAGGQPGQARAAYERAAEVAQQNGLKDQAANAKLGLGMLAANAGQHQAAMGHYAEAARLAKEGGNPVLAIECFRTAGRFAFDLGAVEAASDAWNRALTIAAGLPPKQAQATSAAEVARGQAGIERSRGAEQEAIRLEARAFAFEHGLAGQKVAEA
jgi:tetratricopeptide (TPR) repeat protein